MATSRSNQHPLIGKLVRFDTDDHEAHCLSRFSADLGDGLMLATRLSPRTGEPFDTAHIIVLSTIAQDEWTEIFDSFAAYVRATECPHEADRVVKLVPKAPSVE
jgi:hypothetical protein